MTTVNESLRALEAEFGPSAAAGNSEAPNSEAANSGAALNSGDDDTRKFVIFHIANERFAVPLSEVQEIIRAPEAVRVPLCPPSLEGLANLRGNVLPVVSLRSCFHLPHVEKDDSTRVVVFDYGRPVGLVVDRMANVVSVEPERIEPAAAIRSAVKAELLDGMIRDVDGASIIMILATRRILDQEFGGQNALEGGTLEGVSRAGLHAHAEASERDGGGETVDEDQLVSFVVAKQEYAFPIARVKEIVQLPEIVTEVPNAPRHVLGVITLRNRLLPLVSLRTMFGLPAAVTEASKVVVLSLDENGTCVGVVMDSVKEVLRVPRSQIEAPPSLIAGANKQGDIAAFCRLQDGARLVSVLAAENMFDVAELDRLAGNEEDEMAQARDTAVVSLDSDEQFVLFKLMEEEYGVPIDSVQEIVRVPAELTRIPNTPDFMEGVINLRGAVLPVVDQRRRFGLETAERNDRQRIMVFTIRGARTGFIVDVVSEVRRIASAAIGPAPRLSGEQQRIIRRVANLDAEKRLVLLLDVNQLLDDQMVDGEQTGALRPGELTSAAAAVAA